MDHGSQSLTSRVLSRLILTLVVGGLYIAACASPAVDYQAPQTRDFGDITPYGQMYGIIALIFGVMPPFTIPWSANLLLLVAWILLLCKKNKAAMLIGLVAAILSLSTWAFVDAQMKLLYGTYLWQGSMIAFALGAATIRLREKANAIETYPTSSAFVASRKR